ncbi:MAG: S8 family peptidase [Streptococcaceae bacterium]|jgi:hypothetical protein|nr:S8 family peptidase [Streptococcaceae bacterium]
MNDVLQLKGSFEQKPNSNRPGAPTLAARQQVTSVHLESLRQDLLEMKRFWQRQELLSGALISVYYNKVAAKSNRIKGLLSKGKAANDTIVGAKFRENSQRAKHVITHYVSLQSIEDSIQSISRVIEIIDKDFDGKLDSETFNDKDSIAKIDFSFYGIRKTLFQQIVVDASYVEKFDLGDGSFNPQKEAIVTLYDTKTDVREVLRKIGIRISVDRILDEHTVLLDEDYLEVLLREAPYLIAMAVENFSEFSPSDFKKNFQEDSSIIPEPSNEPTIGVIDTLFDNRVYFSDWVDYHDMVDESIEKTEDDYLHGTAVSSIIVDGPKLNPELDDGCGRFHVRHFGVATAKAFSSFSIIRSIREIISQNRDIHVWNLSLGSNEEVNKNFISAEGAILDQIQYENDVIFVIAGTNKENTEPMRRIGAPADSLNSVVVSSVGINKQPAPYTREGVVLSFFAKPDVSYYGGTSEKWMKVCEPLGLGYVSGTSYAAPWISRKLSYLIDVMDLPREVAKAMLIDSAIGWENDLSYDSIKLTGYGIVPQKIDDILKSKNDEIKFVLSGVSEKFNTYNYKFPVPISDEKYPYIAKATMCYFPKTSRNQGVDYTNTELDLYFGRVMDNGDIKTINDDQQSMESEDHPMTEEEARRLFRKWDNVKHIGEVIRPNARAKKVYGNKLWGMSIKTKERLQPRDGEGIRFGVVVTLREMNGVNRIEDFIYQCGLNGWLVNRIDVDNRVDIYETAEEIVEFE